jgi:hypothetical protein
VLPSNTKLSLNIQLIPSATHPQQFTSQHSTFCTSQRCTLPPAFYLLHLPTLYLAASIPERGSSGHYLGTFLGIHFLFFNNNNVPLVSSPLILFISSCGYRQCDRESLLGQPGRRLSLCGHEHRWLLVHDVPHRGRHQTVLRVPAEHIQEVPRGEWRCAVFCSVLLAVQGPLAYFLM